MGSARVRANGGKKKEKMGEIKSMKEIQCPECGSKWIVTRIITKTRLCRKCGFAWYINEGEGALHERNV